MYRKQSRFSTLLSSEDGVSVQVPQVDGEQAGVTMRVRHNGQVLLVRQPPRLRLLPRLFTREVCKQIAQIAGAIGTTRSETRKYLPAS
jgi:hypothetical protein